MIPRECREERVLGLRPLPRRPGPLLVQVPVVLLVKDPSDREWRLTCRLDLPEGRDRGRGLRVTRMAGALGLPDIFFFFDLS